MITLLISKCLYSNDLHRMTDWHIVEVEVWGPNGFNVKTIRSNPAAVGAVTGTATYASFLSSMLGRSKYFPSNTVGQDIYHYFVWLRDLSYTHICCKDPI